MQTLKTINGIQLRQQQIYLQKPNTNIFQTWPTNPDSDYNPSIASVKIQSPNKYIYMNYSRPTQTPKQLSLTNQFNIKSTNNISIHQLILLQQWVNDGYIEYYLKQKKIKINQQLIVKYQKSNKLKKYQLTLLNNNILHQRQKYKKIKNKQLHKQKQYQLSMKSLIQLSKSKINIYINQIQHLKQQINQQKFIHKYRTNRIKFFQQQHLYCNNQNYTYNSKYVSYPYNSKYVAYPHQNYQTKDRCSEAYSEKQQNDIPSRVPKYSNYFHPTSHQHNYNTQHLPSEESSQKKQPPPIKNLQPQFQKDNNSQKKTARKLQTSKRKETPRQKKFGNESNRISNYYLPQISRKCQQLDQKRKTSLDKMVRQKQSKNNYLQQSLVNIYMGQQQQQNINQRKHASNPRQYNPQQNAINTSRQINNSPLNSSSKFKYTTNIATHQFQNQNQFDDNGSPLLRNSKTNRSKQNILSLKQCIPQQQLLSNLSQQQEDQQYFANVNLNTISRISKQKMQSSQNQQKQNTQLNLRENTQHSYNPQNSFAQSKQLFKNYYPYISTPNKSLQFEFLS